MLLKVGPQKYITKIKTLDEALLFEQYVRLQSKEFLKNLIDYEHFKQHGHDLIIKVNFTWGWLRVYRTKDGDIEWY